MKIGDWIQLGSTIVSSISLVLVFVASRYAARLQREADEKLRRKTQLSYAVNEFLFGLDDFYLVLTKEMYWLEQPRPNQPQRHWTDEFDRYSLAPIRLNTLMVRLRVPQFGPRLQLMSETATNPALSNRERREKSQDIYEEIRFEAEAMREMDDFPSIDVFAAHSAGAPS